jgi:hypothetical protein
MPVPSAVPFPLLFPLFVPVPVAAAARLGWWLSCCRIPLPLLLLVWRRRQALLLLPLLLFTDTISMLLRDLLLLQLFWLWLIVWRQWWSVILQIHVCFTIITSSLQHTQYRHRRTS